MKIKFKKAYNFKNEIYEIDDILKTENLTKEDLSKVWELNEKGYIYPVTIKEFKEFANDIINPKKEEITYFDIEQEE